MSDLEWKTARQKAFRLLSLRNYHSQVLFRKLKEKGFSREICEKVIEDCKRIGLLKDEDAILSEFRRGHGPRYIQFKLKLEAQEVRAVITKTMQREKIAQMAPKLGERERALRTLQRRGFDIDLIIEFFSTMRVD